MPFFEQNFAVENSDIDANGHVNNLVYLRWVQEIATAHWQSCAPREAQDSVLWVVLRHEIDFKAPALFGDLVTAKTWFNAIGPLKFERHTEMRRAHDGQRLALARTLWLPLDAQTRRPKRLSAAVRAAFETAPD